MKKNRVLFGVALVLAAPFAHARYCGQVPSSTTTAIRYECGKTGAYLSMRAVVGAMNERRATARYVITDDAIVWLAGTVTIPTREDAFLQWLANNGFEVAARSREVISLRLRSAPMGQRSLSE